MPPAAVRTSAYLADRAKRRFTPTLNTIPGMGRVEQRLLAHQWKSMRKTVRDVDLLGHYLPGGSFDPERFGEPRAEHKRHRYGFSPFGGGAHKCIGNAFAQLQIKAVLYRLLRRYRLDPVRPGYLPRWDCSAIPTPIDGLPILLRPR